MAEDLGGAEPRAGLSTERVLREAMRRQLASARDVLVRHAWAVPLMESRTNAARRASGTARR